LAAVEMDDKVANMEQQIVELQNQNKELRKQLEYNRNKEAALQKVLCNYDNLLKKVVIERNAKKEEVASTSDLASLESAFCELLQKYEKAKIVVQSFQQNETVLRKQVEEYEDILDKLRAKFATYKTLSENKLEVKNEMGVRKVRSVEGKKRRLLTTILKIDLLFE
jgi:myosin heavy subunit